MSKPFLKWAGGKRQLLTPIDNYIPYGRFDKYIEPFVGGGALFFHLGFKDSIIGDSNPELINAYKIVRDSVDDLISVLGEYPHDKDFYYDLRAKNTKDMLPIDRAARFIYFNKTGFNGLWRVNRKGEFNVSFGNYKNPTICDVDGLRQSSLALAGVEIVDGYYQDTLVSHATDKSLIFLDPPYVPVSIYSDFKRYTKEQFYVEDHVKLAKRFKWLSDSGAYVILTNSNTDIIHDLYSYFERHVITTRRNINKKPGKRSNGEDVIILSRSISEMQCSPL